MKFLISLLNKTYYVQKLLIKTPTKLGFLVPVQVWVFNEENGLHYTVDKAHKPKRTSCVACHCKTDVTALVLHSK